MVNVMKDHTLTEEFASSVLLLHGARMGKHATPARMDMKPPSGEWDQPKCVCKLGGTGGIRIMSI